MYKKIIITYLLVFLGSFSFASQKDTCFLQQKKDWKLYQKIVKQLDMYDKDNYYYLLPIYNRTYEVDASDKWYKNLDTIITHCDNKIQGILSDTEETPCMDNIFYLKAQSLFYQKKYEEAIDVFSTINDLFYQNTDAILESYIGLFNCFFEIKQYPQCQSILDSISHNFDTNELVKNISYLSAISSLMLEMEQWEESINYLQIILAKKIPYQLRTRILFILGQVYETIGEYNNAIVQYTEVSKRLVSNNIMHSYAILHTHLCQKDIEKRYQDSIEDAIYKQTHPTPTTFEPSMVESPSEHNNFENEYPYYFNDLASMFFLQEYDEIDIYDSTYIDDINEDELSTSLLDSIFENWDSISIHIPRTDFSNMTDTIYLPLVDSNYILPEFSTIVSRFGWRKRRYHYGLDFKNRVGDSIYCLFDGVVRISKWNRTYGNLVIVRHYNGLETFYAHCSKLLVTPNTEVKAGQVIALIGNTGRSTGPHLHLETRYKGVPINPEHIIDFEKQKLISDTLIICKELFNYKRSNRSSSSSGATLTNINGGSYYTVRYGDTLSRIAQRYGTSVNNIKRLNGLRSDFIRDGQRLRIK